jgi:hypothetical protein
MFSEADQVGNISINHGAHEYICWYSTDMSLHHHHAGSLPFVRYAWAHPDHSCAFQQEHCLAERVHKQYSKRSC